MTMFTLIDPELHKDKAKMLYIWSNGLHIDAFYKSECVSDDEYDVYAMPRPDVCFDNCLLRDNPTEDSASSFPEHNAYTLPMYLASPSMTSHLTVLQTNKHRKLAQDQALQTITAVSESSASSVIPPSSENRPDKEPAHVRFAREALEER